jgi:hypothetical protein
VLIHFNRMREACYRAARGTGPGDHKRDLVNLLESDGYKFTREDRGFLTAYIKGELNQKRGRPENLDEKSALGRTQNQRRSA